MVSFQWVFNTASQIEIERRQRVVQTQTRSGSINSLSAGGQLWQFRVTPKPLSTWAESRTLIELVDYADRVTPQRISFKNTGLDWITQYRGTLLTNQTVEVLVPSSGGNQIILQNISGGPHDLNKVLFEVGDFIEIPLGILPGRTYTVVESVAPNATVITLNRPIIDIPIGNSSLIKYGVDVSWRVICTQMPTWSFVGKDLVQWNGDFTFVEI